MTVKGQHGHHHISIPTLPTASLSSSSSSDSSSTVAAAAAATAPSPIQVQSSNTVNDNKVEDTCIKTTESSTTGVDNTTSSSTSGGVTVPAIKMKSSSKSTPEQQEEACTESKGTRTPTHTATTSPTESVSKIQNNDIDNNKNTNNTLEKRLFHALQTSQVNNPSIKEFKELWAFANAVKTFYGKENDIDLVLDVAGGHGALGALLLILLKSSSKCVVVDPACESIKGGVELAWGNEFLYGGNISQDSKKKKKELKYRNECLRTGLRSELDEAIHGRSSTSPKRILVVACHACQHLADETLEIACSYGANVAVMPCCQKDLTGGSFEATAAQLKMNIGVMMDILAAGKVLSWSNGRESGVKYQVEVKVIDEKITPQNRLVLARAVDLDTEDCEQKKIKDAHARLARAYHRAHGNTKRGISRIQEKLKASVCMKSLGVGIATGVILSIAWSRRR